MRALERQLEENYQSPGSNLALIKARALQVLDLALFIGAPQWRRGEINNLPISSFGLLTEVVDLVLMKD
ncbi:hypothetical protein ACLOJK_029643 [Asimina triloba]